MKLLTLIVFFFVSSPLILDWLYSAGQIIATENTTSPQKVAKEGKSPYFREI